MPRLIPLPKRVVWAATGAAVAYFYDPENGRSRRAQAKDQLNARFRDVRQNAERKTGALRNAGTSLPENDRTLVDKINSEVLGAPRFQTSDVVIDAHEGVVTLRGELPDAESVKELVKAVERVPGVTSVENLLHGPGEPAPNKEASLRS